LANEKNIEGTPPSHIDQPVTDIISVEEATLNFKKQQNIIDNHINPHMV
jgi:hypothetical protein